MYQAGKRSLGVYVLRMERKIKEMGAGERTGHHRHGVKGPREGPGQPGGSPGRAGAGRWAGGAAEQTPPDAGLHAARGPSHGSGTRGWLLPEASDGVPAISSFWSRPRSRAAGPSSHHGDPPPPFSGPS